MRKKRGFSLIESAIVVGFASIMLTGVWATYKYNSVNRVSSSLNDDISFAMENLIDATIKHKVGLLTTADAAGAAAAFFPEGYIATGTYIHKPGLPGAWQVRANDGTTSFALTYVYDPDMTNSNPSTAARTAMPVDLCNKFLPRMFSQLWSWKRGDSTGTYGLLTNSTSMLVSLGVSTNPFADPNGAGVTGLRTACSRGFKTWAGPSAVYIR